jgi:hypothetical protein
MRFLKGLMSPFALMSMILMTALVFGIHALAQAADIPVPPTTVNDVISALAELVGVSSTAGATTLAIVAASAQLISKFVLSPLWDSLKLDPKYKFLVFAITSLVLTVVPLMIQGATLIAALSSGAVLLLVMQYGHRIYELFFEAEKPA